jgi:hypothetical protein
MQDDLKIENRDNLDEVLWGAEAIGAEMNLDPRQAYHALESGHLPATKIGHKWASTRRRLRSVVGA